MKKMRKKKEKMKKTQKIQKMRMILTFKKMIRAEMMEEMKMI